MGGPGQRELAIGENCWEWGERKVLRQAAEEAVGDPGVGSRWPCG